MTTHWWQWRRLSGPERIEQYTLQSLQCVLWAFPALAVLGALSATTHHAGAFLALALGVVAQAVIGSRLLALAVRTRSRGVAVPWAWVAVFLALGAALVSAALVIGRPGSPLTTMAVTAVWGVWAISLTSFRRLPLDAFVIVASLLWPLSNGEQHPFAIAFSMVLGLVAGLFLLGTMRSSLWLLGVVRELDEARAAQAQLAVAEERLRFSRDVHDVLGRQLAAIAVQADLGATLARRGTLDEAEATMSRVRSLANEALKEARELARGYRAPDLAQEVEGATALLRAAGIECRARLDGLPSSAQEPAAWVIRESVTNVLRHSQATIVEITWAVDALTVRNNGAGDLAPAAAGGGSGLTGLRERLATVGGTLSVRHEGEEFEIKAVLS